MNSSTIVYQKDLEFGSLLPYSDLVESEANEMFDRIKRNLSLAVQKRELWPGAMFWTLRLQRFKKCISCYCFQERKKYF